MALYNHPPNWPEPPKGWTPPEGWKPNPKWPPAPSGWQFWIDEPQPAPSAAVTPLALLAPVESAAPLARFAPVAYHGARRKPPFGAITGAVTGAVSAALQARGRRVRSTLVFGAVCIVLLAVIAVIVVGVPKKSTNVGKVTSGALPSAPSAQARPASTGTGAAKPSASAPTSQAPASPTAAVTPPVSTAPATLTPASDAPLVAGAASTSPTPTPTPTPSPPPSPTPSPTPTPTPPVPTTCAASVSDASPHHNEVVNVIVQTAPGAHVTVTAHYHTERTTHHGVADASGEASVPFDVLNAIYGFNVRVTVVATGAGGTLDCATSYTPAP